MAPVYITCSTLMALNDELKKTVLIRRDFTKPFIPEVSHKWGIIKCIIIWLWLVADITRALIG